MVVFPFLLYGLLFLRLMLSDRAISPGGGLAARAAQRMGLAGRVLAIAAAGYFFAIMLVVIADFADFFSEVMPATPDAVFRAILLLLTTLALLSGIEVFGRVALILIPVVIAFILGGLLGNLSSFKSGMLQPFFDSGVKPVLKGSFLQLSYTSELFALGFLAGHLGFSGREARRASYLGFLPVVALFFLISIFLFGVLGESYAIRANFKLFSLFHYGLPYSATGYESLFIVVWVTIFFAKVALVQCAFGMALGEITPFKKELYFIIAGIAAFLGCYFVFESRQDLFGFYFDVYPPFSIAFTLLFLGLIHIFPGKDNGSDSR